ncbi:copper chaperone PCu(A)C [Sulfitobacter porphyrae]|uniref:Copper chaperone PCu(A)C n=1 Tax=Sulfitobacter porphyrae TaxID=1246864 RepID=A0ABW2AZT4_9RHOB
MPADETVTLGDLELSAYFVRATLPNQPVAGGFLTVTNGGDSDDTLIAASSDTAARVEIHEMAMQGEVMKMRALENGLPIPAGETVMLKPGGYHIMFMDLSGPMTEGDTAEVTLTFEKAGAVTLTMPVLARDGTAHDAHGGHDAHHKISE